MKIDASDPNNLSSKVLSERETRKRMLKLAEDNGNKQDMIILFDKIDKLLRNCTNEKERADIAKLGAYQAWILCGGGGELYVDGGLVAKDK